MTSKPRYLNLFTDFGFKRVFGEEANKDLLMDFLNQLLPKEYLIHDLNFSKNEHQGRAEEDRKAIFDLYCVSSKGERFVVELQKAKQDFFKDRAVYYSSFPIQEQAIRGDNWNYKLTPVFTIGILNFIFKDHEKDSNFHHIVQLKDQDCNIFYDKLHYIYLELPKFKKTLQECKTRYDKWLWIFKNLPDLTEIPEALRENIFVKLFQITELGKMSHQEQEAYENSLKYLRDLHNVVDTAFREGIEEGLQKGLEKGLEEGEKKSKIATAQKMKTKGFDTKIIHELTGLSEEEINRI